jgi:hypothetical protein
MNSERNTCEIKWYKNMRRGEWNSLLARCPRTTLLQSYAYAQTMREVHKQGACHGVISIDGQDAGIVQMQEISLFNGLIHTLSIDRGPLWFDDSVVNTNVFMNVLNNQFPRRFGRKRRFIPEVDKDYSDISPDTWIRNNITDNYKTFIVDLYRNLDEIRRNLKQKWRNILNKSEKIGLKCHFDHNLEGLSLFLKNYMVDRAKKQYSGASPKFLSSLCKYASINNDCYLLHAMNGKDIIASILVFQHGQGATYQTGWTSDKGRQSGAHHYLLWQAIILLKKYGVTHFDLGGYNDENEGLQKFKAGLNGQKIALIGSYS